MLVRATIVSLCLLLAAFAIDRASDVERIPPRESFATFPMDVGEWHAQSSDRFDQGVLTVLGADEYINRLYTASAMGSVGLYVGFYRSQRQGDTMHSPLNCLPGAGWEPTSRRRLAMDVRTSSVPGAELRRIEVNRLLIQRGLDRQVVLYWYQSHGRVESSEYWAKVYTVLDAIRINRTDGAMVRVISPISGGESSDEVAAERVSVALAAAVFPLLGRYLPE